jgi:hypothetical protein
LHHDDHGALVIEARLSPEAGEIVSSFEDSPAY